MSRPAVQTRQGFTLIELSIVLVIIGLIVGGVLVGRDLIASSAVRAQITQIEKYQSATNTFRGKYNYLPGDITAAAAAQFGLATHGTIAGQGDADGFLQGYSSTASANGLFQDAGETPMFWVDLSAANLIDGSFTTARANAMTSGNIPASQIYQFFPASKIDAKNFITVGALQLRNGASWQLGNANYFTISVVTALRNSNLGIDNDSSPGLTVRAAYSIDKKLDDGLPQSGTVLAMYASYWADPTTTVVTPTNFPAGYTTAITGGSTTCYDNNGVSGTQQYSITQGNGAYVNCALSFKFQ